MSDIVERLRELEAVESELACECDCPPEATANYRYAMTCAEAADEIKRLRAALSTARADALEEAAKVAEGMWWQGHGYLATEPYAAAAQAGNEIAAAIRALANPSDSPSGA